MTPETVPSSTDPMIEWRSLLTAGPDAGKDAEAPVYARIRDSIADMISAGTLPPGAALPPIRTLAGLLGVNPRTVARAYKDLGDRALIEGNRGGGSRVTLPRDMAPSRISRQARDDSIAPPAISSRLFELARAPGVIAFTGNYPSPALSDAGTFKTRLVELVQGDSDPFFRYDPPSGREELRDGLLPFLAAHSIITSAEEIVVTSGGQQGLDLVVRCCLKPGDAVMVEEPVYFGVINVIRAARAKPIPMPVGPNGPDLNRLADAIRKHRPKLIIVNPTFQNPTGHVMPEPARIALLDLAMRSGVPILEDDHCPELRFRGHPVKPLRALPGGRDCVFYTRGFGKVFIPGIRIGFLLPPRQFLQRCLSMKATTDLQSPAMLQGALAAYLSHDDWPGYLANLRQSYRTRQGQLYDLMVRHLRGLAAFSLPDGGLSFWLELDGAVDTREFYFSAVRRGVAFAIADSFSPGQQHSSALRISFGLTEPDQYEEGVIRLAAVLRGTLRAASTPGSAVI